MTLVYISLPSGQLASYRIAIGKAVQQGLHAAFDLTPKKRSRILTDWALEEPAIDLPHFGLRRREGTVLVVVAFDRPSSESQRSKFLSTFAKEVEARTATHPQNLILSLANLGQENSYISEIRQSPCQSESHSGSEETE